MANTPKDSLFKSTIINATVMKRKRDDENEEDFKTKISKSFLEFISEPVIEEYLKIPSEEMKRVAGRDQLNKTKLERDLGIRITIPAKGINLMVTGTRTQIEAARRPIMDCLTVPTNHRKLTSNLVNFLTTIYNSQVKTLEDRFSVTVEFDEDTVLVSGPSRANIEDTLDSIAWMEKRLNDAELRKVEAIRARSEWMKKERK